MVQILVSKLRSIGVISDRGLQIGRLVDVIFDEKDGKILNLVVKPFSKETIGSTAKDSSGNALLPFSSVMAIKDYIVVNERVLAIQQLKAQPRAVPELPPRITENPQQNPSGTSPPEV